MLLIKSSGSPPLVSKPWIALPTCDWGANCMDNQHRMEQISRLPVERNIPMDFANGDLVGVQCSIQLGPFPDERLVKVETEDGTIWGFVERSNLQMYDNDDAENDRGYIKSAVVDQASESILVRMFGSFFTTAIGLATVKRNCLTRLAIQ